LTPTLFPMPSATVTLQLPAATDVTLNIEADFPGETVATDVLLDLAVHLLVPFSEIVSVCVCPGPEKSSLFGVTVIGFETSTAISPPTVSIQTFSSCPAANASGRT
jgi:hypothetical protein